MLYSTYRPQTFHEVAGQENNIKTLKEQCRSRKYDSAYLFAGHRGTGKTTIARILSRTVCCENPSEEGPCNKCKNCRSILDSKTLDCIELDAASHNSISDIKELIVSTKYLPTTLPKKIYIIDEVHNLSTAAFDALLKTIEEPPEHCLFILCTTEIHKIPATIRSRCSIYQFSSLSIETICSRLIFVLKELGKQYEEDALKLIAKQADGSMRDALSIMEKLIISCEEVTVEHVTDSLCLMDNDICLHIIQSIVERDGSQAILLLRKIYEEGKNLSQLVDNLLQCFADGIVLYTSSGNATIYNTQEYSTSLYEMIRSCQIEVLFWYVDQFSILREKIRNSLNPYMDILIYIVKCCNLKLFQDNVSLLLARISAVEEKMQKSQYCIPDTDKIEKGSDESLTTDDMQTQNKQETDCAVTSLDNSEHDSEFESLDGTAPFDTNLDESTSSASNEESDDILTESAEEENGDSVDDYILSLLGGHL